MFFKIYTGGGFDANAYLYVAAQGNVLFDAPDGSDEFFAKDKIDLLILTHGHFDHTADMAAIQRRHGCKVAAHADTVPMLLDGGFFRKFGLPFDIEPIEKCEVIIGEGKRELLGEGFEFFDVPGHCPGSLCTLIPARGGLITGDVLFEGSIGRTDLYGGDAKLLVRGIRSKLLSLPPLTQVFPGHGAATTIGEEAHSNPFLKF